MMRAHITVAVAAAVTAVIVGTGCTSSEAEPQSAPSSADSTLTPSPTVQPTDPTVAPGPEEPVVPDAAQAPGRAGAEAFVRYYIDLLNYAANTGDTTALRAAAAKECGGCEDYAALYEATYAAGGWFRDPGWRPFGAFSRREGDHVTVLLQVEAPPVTYVKRSGAQPRRASADVYSLRFEAARTGRAWTTTHFEGQ